MGNWVSSNQDFVTYALVAAGVLLIIAAVVVRSLRGLHINLYIPSRPSIFAPATAILIVGGVLAFSIQIKGAEIRQFLQQPHPYIADAIARLRIPRPGDQKDWAGTVQRPRMAAPAKQEAPDQTQRRTLSEIACRLLLEEKRITVAQVDACIAEGAADPDKVFTYITGGSLGAPWESLSQTAKQFAIDKAAADAKGPHQAAQQIAALNDYQKCETAMLAKRDAFVQARCKFDPSSANITDYWDCSARVRQSAEYRQFNCASPF